MRRETGAPRSGRSVRREAERLDPNRALAGGGEMGALMRSIDWAKTPIGPVEHWSAALRSTVALLLHNHSGFLLWWGPKFVQLYNDAYRPLLGEKHPCSMGQPGSECWSEIWNIIGPMVERPYRGGPASTSEDLLLGLRRKGFLEEAHFRVAYSPVPDESVEPTGIGGVLATFTETTEQIYGERQLRTLRDLGEPSAREAREARTLENACAAAAETLAENPWDVPFALFYLLDATGQRARRVSSVGFAQAQLERVAPAEIDLSLQGPGPWSIKQAVLEKRSLTLDDLSPYSSALPTSPWSETPRSALVLPLEASEQANAWGVLVCGVSPHRALDTGYRTFFELCAGQVALALRNAHALEEALKGAEALAELDRAENVGLRLTADAERNRLERAVRFSEIFVGILGHDLRNPLSAISAAANLLESRTDSERLRTPLARIVASTERMDRMIAQILDFTSIRLGRGLPLDRKPVDLAKECRATLDELQPVLRCNAQLDVLENTEGSWDKDRLSQLLSNLIANACQHGTPGSIVRIRLDGSAASGVRAEIQNAGAIPLEILPLIFEPLRAGKRGPKREGSSGLGLGLYISRQIVLAHGGSIQVESSAAEGTRFSFFLPRHLRDGEGVP